MGKEKRRDGIRGLENGLGWTERLGDFFPLAPFYSPPNLHQEATK